MSNQFNPQTGFQKTHNENNQYNELFDCQLGENSKLMPSNSIPPRLETIVQVASGTQFTQNFNSNLQSRHTGFSNPSINNTKVEQLYDKVASSNLMSVQGSNIREIQDSRSKNIQSPVRGQEHFNTNRSQNIQSKYNQFDRQNGKGVNHELNKYELRQSNRQLRLRLNTKSSDHSDSTIPKDSIKGPLGRPGTYNVTSSIILPQNLRSCLNFQSYEPLQQSHFGTAEYGKRYELPDYLEKILGFDQILEKQIEGDRVIIETNQEKSWIVE